MSCEGVEPCLRGIRVDVVAVQVVQVGVSFNEESSFSSLGGENPPGLFSSSEFSNKAGVLLLLLY